ncbi:MAG: DNA polymerase III subunit delta' [Burkholderiaceae bacterium]|nr:DNA polymerase III subunit delta' [Burkholderiaceae bacterium]MCD8537139.1 DNA polymerase III subunit delta' [Burkholderiaceae bacterium]MCD8566286.1 DNA polymerase III subunit delta' [Burkholderiaceae bacterium]
MARFLPWQVDDAKRLLDDTSHLPHALLIHGISGTGKREFARAFAASLLCEDRQEGLACGKCQSCLWIAAGNHPDLKLVRPQAVAVREGAMNEFEGNEEGSAETSTAKRKPSEEIKIEQIRALESWYHRSTHRAGWRIVVLYPADALSVVSANALLKALEEPAPETLFLLTSDAPDRLLPTIVSRCQKFALTLPNRADCERWLTGQGVKDASQWLAAAGGAPLAALEMSQSLETACPDWAQALVTTLSEGNLADLPAMADNLAKLHAVHWLTVLQRLGVDVSLACAGLPVRYFPRLQASFDRLARRDHLARTEAVTAWLNQQARLANHPLSPKLFAQVCLERFCDAVL